MLIYDDCFGLLSAQQEVQVVKSHLADRIHLKYRMGKLILKLEPVMLMQQVL